MEPLRLLQEEDVPLLPGEREAGAAQGQGEIHQITPQQAAPAAAPGDGAPRARGGVGGGGGPEEAGGELPQVIGGGGAVQRGGLAVVGDKTRLGVDGVQNGGAVAVAQIELGKAPDRLIVQEGEKVRRPLAAAEEHHAHRFVPDHGVEIVRALPVRGHIAPGVPVDMPAQLDPEAQPLQAPDIGLVFIPVRHVAGGHDADGVAGLQ